MWQSGPFTETNIVNNSNKKARKRIDGSKKLLIRPIPRPLLQKMIVNNHQNTSKTCERFNLKLHGDNLTTFRKKDK